MSLTFITARTGIPDEHERVIVAESAKPWLKLAGYVLANEAGTVAVPDPHEYRVVRMRRSAITNRYVLP